jgi:cytochrome c-type biogenesis protein CcmH/NrfF
MLLKETTALWLIPIVVGLIGIGALFVDQIRGVWIIAGAVIAAIWVRFYNNQHRKSA